MMDLGPMTIRGAALLYAWIGAIVGLVFWCGWLAHKLWVLL